MCFLNIFKKSKNLEVGKFISWKGSINTIFKVVEFDKNGTTTDKLGNLKTKSMFSPYGYLIVVNPDFAEKLKLPIVHKDDFFLAESVYDDPHLPEVVKTQDFLVTYRPKFETPTGMAGVHHALHYVITPSGTLNNYNEKYGKTKSLSVLESIFVNFSWDELRVQINQNPVI